MLIVFNMMCHRTITQYDEENSLLHIDFYSVDAAAAALPPPAAAAAAPPALGVEISESVSLRTMRMSYRTACITSHPLASLAVAQAGADVS